MKSLSNKHQLYKFPYLFRKFFVIYLHIYFENYFVPFPTREGLDPVIDFEWPVPGIRSSPSEKDIPIDYL